MQHRMLWLFLLIILSGCADTTALTETPGAVHLRWLTAVRSNDRTAALALVDADMAERALFVEQTLRTMQDLTSAPGSPTGALVAVEPGAPTAQGQRQRAISVWQFAHKTWCYATELTATPAGWRVAQWGQIARCPVSAQEQR